MKFWFDSWHLLITSTTRLSNSLHKFKENRRKCLKKNKAKKQLKKKTFFINREFDFSIAALIYSRTRYSCVQLVDYQCFYRRNNLIRSNHHRKVELSSWFQIPTSSSVFSFALIAVGKTSINPFTHSSYDFNSRVDEGR